MFARQLHKLALNHIRWLIIPCNPYHLPYSAAGINQQSEYLLKAFCLIWILLNQIRISQLPPEILLITSAKLHSLTIPFLCPERREKISIITVSLF